MHRRQGYRWIKAAGGRFPVENKPRSGRYLEHEDRLRIADLHLQAAGVREIARELGRQPSTISRRNGKAGRHGYRPHAAQKQCEARARRPKACRLYEPALAALEQLDLPRTELLATGPTDLTFTHQPCV